MISFLATGEYHKYDTFVYPPNQPAGKIPGFNFLEKVKSVFRGDKQDEMRKICLKAYLTEESLTLLNYESCVDEGIDVSVQRILDIYHGLYNQQIYSYGVISWTKDSVTKVWSFFFC